MPDHESSHSEEHICYEEYYDDDFVRVENVSVVSGRGPRITFMNGIQKLFGLKGLEDGNSDGIFLPPLYSTGIEE